MLFLALWDNVNKGKMVETLFALAGYNKNGKKGRTGPEIRQARCVNVDK